MNITLALNDLPPHKGLAAAVSGGLDSTVLLSLLVKLRDGGELTAPLRAIHINHQLLPAADRFQTHCQKICDKQQVPLTVIPVQVDVGGPAGPEGEARAARYDAFLDELQADEILLQAHHRDDLMETFLLRLMRGAGPRGLSAIPPLRRLGKGWLARPLLHADRSAILRNAEAAGLDWVEDPSNTDTALDRNYCRHTVLPAIAERWPTYRDSWEKTLTLITEAETLLQTLAEQDLRQAMQSDPYRLGVGDAEAAQRDNNHLGGGEADANQDGRNRLGNGEAEAEQGGGTYPPLPLPPIRTLTPARQRNALRLFLRQAGLPDPSWHQLQQLVDNIIPATPQSHPEFILGGRKFQAYRDHLHIIPPLPPLPPSDTAAPVWQPDQSPIFPLPDNGHLKATPVTGKGLARTPDARFTIAYRSNGETCKLTGRPTKTLKQILQESGLPPWLRPRLPLLYQGDRLICIPNIGPAEAAAAAPHQPGWLVEWQPPKG